LGGLAIGCQLIFSHEPLGSSLLIIGQLRAASSEQPHYVVMPGAKDAFRITYHKLVKIFPSLYEKMMVIATTTHAEQQYI
jgi:hypothetical protein